MLMVKAEMVVKSTTGYALLCTVMKKRRRDQDWRREIRRGAAIKWKGCQEGRGTGGGKDPEQEEGFCLRFGLKLDKADEGEVRC